LKKVSYRLDDWKKGKFGFKKNNVVRDLVDNFNWEIAKQRRNKGLSRKQLGEKVGATEEEIKMIEMKDLPSDDFVLINKIENILEINLRKEKSSRENISLSNLKSMDERMINKEIEKTNNKLMRGEVKGENDKMDVFSGNEIELVDID
jgi:transcriptional regulator with XRE-family HTH domain